MPNPDRILTTGEKHLCEYGAAVGVVLSIICLVQHTLFVIPRSLTNALVPAYFFMIVAFITWGLQQTYSIILLIIGGILSLIVEWLWISHASFSLIVMLLFMYHVVTVVILFMQGIPQKLKKKKEAERAEQDMWAGKI